VPQAKKIGVLMSNNQLTRPFGHEALQVGIDRPVLGGHGMKGIRLSTPVLISVNTQAPPRYMQNQWVG
jgi:hypothetical protein